MLALRNNLQQLRVCLTEGSIDRWRVANITCAAVLLSIYFVAWRGERPSQPKTLTINQLLLIEVRQYSTSSIYVQPTDVRKYRGCCCFNINTKRSLLFRAEWYHTRYVRNKTKKVYQVFVFPQVDIDSASCKLHRL